MAHGVLTANNHSWLFFATEIPWETTLNRIIQLDDSVKSLWITKWLKMGNGSNLTIPKMHQTESESGQKCSLRSWNCNWLVYIITPERTALILNDSLSFLPHKGQGTTKFIPAYVLVDSLIEGIKMADKLALSSHKFEISDKWDNPAKAWATQNFKCSETGCHHIYYKMQRNVQ